MTAQDYMKILVEDLHSAVVSTIGDDGHPETRTIDMMLWDDKGVYFLTAKGKNFYKQLMEQKYLALAAVKDKKSISLRGRIRNIGTRKLNEIFEKNPYMKEIYPEGTRSPLEIFLLYEGSGEYFDISVPSHVVRDAFSVGSGTVRRSGYYVGADCIGCKLCYSVCPQKCIDISKKPVEINQNRCLRCGKCAQICPKQTIEKIE